MRSQFNVVLAAGLSSLSACAPVLHGAEAVTSSQAVPTRAPSGCAQIRSYTLATVVEGEFTASDCSIVEAGERELVDYYEFTTPEQRDVFALLEAPGLDVQLALVRPDGIQVKAQPYEGAFTSLSVQVPAGTYRITLRSRGDASSQGRLLGGYTLSTSTDRVGFQGCTRLAEVQPGRTVQGQWSVEDCRQPIGARDVGRYADYYLLQVPQSRDIAVSLESPAINSYVQLFRREGALLKSGDAFSQTGRIATQLAPGAYVLAVGTSSVNQRETGRYTLSVR
jgi:hypothetical protein